jgi:phosphatidylserine decarboxylase
MWYLKLLPKNLLSRTVGRLARVEAPKFVAETVRNWFAVRYKLNMQEAEWPLEAYPSTARLFTRKLKAGARPLAAEKVVHPCDAQLNRADQIDGDTVVQAKGHDYSLSHFLAETEEEVTAKYNEGSILTYYLCPTDYHRVHCPLDGKIESITHVPGALWPVNSWSVENVDQLFAINERVIFRLHTDLGPVALVMVGATNVGQIGLSVGSDEFKNEFRTNSPNHRSVVTKNFEPAISIQKGDELGVFHMGSTVVVVYPKMALPLLPPLGPVKVGARV